MTGRIFEIARIEVSSYKMGHTFTGKDQVEKFLEATGHEVKCVSPQDNSELMLMEDAHLVRTHVIGEAADGVHTSVIDFTSNLLSDPIELFAANLNDFVEVAKRKEWPENGPRIVAFFALYEITTTDDGITFDCHGIMDMQDEDHLSMLHPLPSAS